ncbi:MAG: ABC transporter permease [Lachnospiraceae bacterium]|nr:ABC transporter permease [Lachnospiraceae bacterium]
MAKNLIRKLLILIGTLLVVSFVVFFMFEIIPGDPALNKLGTEATPERVEMLREEMGLNHPFPVRYFKWVTGLLRGNFGNSYTYNCSVADLIVDKIPINLTMSFMAIIWVIVFSVPIGIYTAKHVGGIADQVISVLSQIMMAFPSFLVGIFLTFVFGIVLKWFSPGAFVSYDRDFWKFIVYLICPSIALALPKCAMCIRLLRGNILDEAAKDYAQTAYSRGNSTTGLMYKHVLKNAIMPTITFIGMLLADMIASGIIVEQTFGIPGLGKCLVTAISGRDYPVVEAIVMLIALLIVVLSMITDFIYTMIDPRVRGSV